jgi:predicted dehydrogenase
MTSASPIRWGILSPGRIAHKFADALTAVPDARLVAVAGRDLGRAQAFAGRWGGRALPSMDALLADDQVDAVYIASPHSEHHHAASAALRAGKHVLCEKALVATAAQARELIALSHQYQRLLMEALWTRFLPGLAQVQAWLNAGAIGQLRSLNSSFCFNPPFDAGSRLFAPALAGGALLDIGIYCISISQWAVSQVHEAQVHEAQVLSVQVAGERGPTGVDHRVHAQLGFAGGEVAQFVTALDGEAPNEFWLLGTEGSIVIEQRFWHAEHVRLVRSGRPDERVHAPHRHNGFEYQIEEAQRCIRAGCLESPGMTHAQSLATLEVIDEMRRQIGVRYPFETGP